MGVFSSQSLFEAIARKGDLHRRNYRAARNAYQKTLRKWLAKITSLYSDITIFSEHIHIFQYVDSLLCHTLAILIAILSMVNIAT